MRQLLLSWLNSPRQTLLLRSNILFQYKDDVIPRLIRRVELDQVGVVQVVHDLDLVLHHVLPETDRQTDGHRSRQADTMKGLGCPLLLPDQSSSFLGQTFLAVFPLLPLQEARAHHSNVQSCLSASVVLPFLSDSWLWWPSLPTWHPRSFQRTCAPVRNDPLQTGQRGEGKLGLLQLAHVLHPGNTLEKGGPGDLCFNDKSKSDLWRLGLTLSD